AFLARRHVKPNGRQFLGKPFEPGRMFLDHTPDRSQRRREVRTNGQLQWCHSIATILGCEGIPIETHPIKYLHIWPRLGRHECRVPLIVDRRADSKRAFPSSQILDPNPVSFVVTMAGMPELSGMSMDHS